MEQWKRLFELADKLKALQPWNFLYEDEIFGVRDPGTGTIGFISFMGARGEHYAMSVYLGERALMKFFNLSENADNMSPESILEISQLQVSFEGRDQLEKEDREIIKAIGKKYSGKSAWPMFRSFRPGMVPWFLEEAEKESMICFLEQAVEVASRPFIADLLQLKPAVPNVFLIRDYALIAEKPSWKDSFHQVHELPETEITGPLPIELVRGVSTLPAGNLILEADFFMTPAQIRPPGVRPFFSYMLLLVDKKSEMVLGFENLDPSNGLEPMYGKIPAILLKQIKGLKTRPKEIHVSSDVLTKLGNTITRGINVPVIKKNRLPALGKAKKDVMRYLQG